MLKIIINDREFQVSDNGSDMINDQPFIADFFEYREGKFHVIHNLKSYSAEIISFDRAARSFTIKVNNSTMQVTVLDQFDDLLAQMGIDQTAGARVNDIKAPMPGMVLNVMVENGQPIKKGDAIVVLEAMKMENILKSPADGIVTRVLVTRGDKVEKNQVMVNLQ